ncbi:protein transport protein SFT2-like [Argonauta hians]
MAELGKDLKDYLSRSSSSIMMSSSFDKAEENNKSESSSLKNGFKYLFGRSGPPDRSGETTDANSWFTKAQSDPLLPSLTKKQRILGFVTFLLLGTLFFSLSFLYVPLLVLKARKFSLLFTLGSVFFLMSFSLLWGPVNHLRHLFSGGRLPFTCMYFSTLLGTLYFAIWLKYTLLTVVFAAGQIITLVWFVISHIPGGQSGLRFFSKLFYAAASKTAEKTLPV